MNRPEAIPSLGVRERHIRYETCPAAVMPFFLKDAPSLIERLLPAHKISAEAQKERKAGAGQTLTALGSYWKGRKPLILVRACVLGALLPATDDPEKDLEIFEKLMAIDDEAFLTRAEGLSARAILERIYLPNPAAYFALSRNTRDVPTSTPVDFAAYPGLTVRWKREVTEKAHLKRRVLAEMSYSEKLEFSKRPEEIDGKLYRDIWDEVNAHLDTNAQSHAELVEQLGIMHFGHRPKVADTFCGGGSIPFEAARLGCDVYASDLNPIACMLTWGALNIIGADEETRAEIEQAQQQVAEAVDREITALGIEHDQDGNRAKAYLYCLETRRPETGWWVPMAPSWIISKTYRVYAKLVPNHAEKRFAIEVVTGASEAEMQAAEKGTVQDGYLVYELDGELYRTAIKPIRGDYTKPDDTTGNRLRLWEKSDFKPCPEDIFQERLYCIQWTCSRYDAAKDKIETWTEFRSVTAEDLLREAKVEELVAENLARWQEEGLVPDMAIEPGEKTNEPIRTRGWTYWHHLFNPRQIMLFAYAWRELNCIEDRSIRAAVALAFSGAANRQAKLCFLDVNPGGGGRYPQLCAVFTNQALNTLYNYGSRAFPYMRSLIEVSYPSSSTVGDRVIHSKPANSLASCNDIWITDPPYADAIHYHEITEFFIAWLRKNPPAPFKDWIWDSRRALAIQGGGDDFRRSMVAAYKAMAEHMPDNGLQIVMFTHQDNSVWVDMANIFWASGLRVTMAWYIATETTSELKKGGYVQGTVLLVLRKRQGSESTYKDELVQAIRDEVQKQIETLTGLNQMLKPKNRDENLFTDADLQMAGYAAALRMLTSYVWIDGTDMTREALRPCQKGEKTLVDEVIAWAMQIATEFLVPEGLDAKVWETLKNNAERFYLKMLEMEAQGLKKLDNYQNFSKAFKVADYGMLMASSKPNHARLKSAVEFGCSEFSGSEFGRSPRRAVLFALMALGRGKESEDVLRNLRDNVGENYPKRRDDLIAISNYLANKLARIRPEEASEARVLSGLIRNEKALNGSRC
jgi:putative DNA methylase